MSFTIRDLPAKERPRERLHELGSHSLSLQELLEIILGQGSTGDSVHQVAQRLLTKYSGLNKLSEASVAELQLTRGVGHAKSAQLHAVFELGKRLASTNTQVNYASVFTSEAAYKLISPYLKHKKKEHLMLFCLDVRGKLICKPEIISVGTLDCSLVHPREIFNVAIRNCAAKVLLAHNHPSGSPEPSIQDLEVTNQLMEASKIIGIEFLDHIIIGAKDYISIRQLKPEMWT